MNNISKCSDETIVIRSVGRFYAHDVMTREQFDARYQELLRSYVPIKAIRDTVMDLPGNTVGVHIRRTDHVKSYNISTDEKFMALMDKCVELYGDIYFFLATDDQQVKHKLINRYRDRIFSYEMDCTRDSKAGIQGAVIDLLTLSRTRMLLGSCHSSFSGMASAFNSIPTIMVGDEPFEAQIEAVKSVFGEGPGIKKSRTIIQPSAITF